MSTTRGVTTETFHNFLYYETHTKGKIYFGYLIGGFENGDDHSFGKKDNISRSRTSVRSPNLFYFSFVLFVVFPPETIFGNLIPR